MKNRTSSAALVPARHRGALGAGVLRINPGRCEGVLALDEWMETVEKERACLAAVLKRYDAVLSERATGPVEP